MATAPASASAPTPAETPAGKSKLKRRVLLILLVLVMAAVAAGAAYFELGRHGVHSTPAAVPPPQPIFLALDPITVNLQGDDGQRYLRVGLSLKFTDPKAQDYLTEHMPELRSRLLLALSNKQPDDLTTLEGKRALAAELKALVEQPTQPGNQHVQISDVLFTEFVVQ
jgi:flagellar protein FliL